LVSGTSLDGIDDALPAFAAGPGNAMLDDWAAAHVDLDGALAGAGRPAVPVHPLTSSSLTISK
jgi:1,6-anhydro-N-acetylmuramate kinase